MGMCCFNNHHVFLMVIQVRKCMHIIDRSLQQQRAVKCSPRMRKKGKWVLKGRGWLWRESNSPGNPYLSLLIERAFTKWVSFDIATRYPKYLCTTVCTDRINCILKIDFNFIFSVHQKLTWVLYNTQRNLLLYNITSGFAPSL